MGRRASPKSNLLGVVKRPLQQDRGERESVLVERAS